MDTVFEIYVPDLPPFTDEWKPCEECDDGMVHKRDQNKFCFDCKCISIKCFNLREPGGWLCGQKGSLRDSMGHGHEFGKKCSMCNWPDLNPSDLPKEVPPAHPGPDSAVQ